MIITVVRDWSGDTKLRGTSTTMTGVLTGQVVGGQTAIERVVHLEAVVETLAVELMRIFGTK